MRKISSSGRGRCMSVNWPRAGSRENSSIRFQVFFVKSACAAGTAIVTLSASLVIVPRHLRVVILSTQYFYSIAPLTMTGRHNGDTKQQR